LEKVGKIRENCGKVGKSREKLRKNVEDIVENLGNVGKSWVKLRKM
jgi:hypothetical protein